MAVPLSSTNATGLRRGESLRRSSGISCACQDSRAELQVSTLKLGPSSQLQFGAGRRTALVATAAALAFLGRSNAVGLATIEDSKADCVREVLRQVITKSKAPGLLRLVFHDAGTYNASQGTGGMNGSVVLELERPENAGLDRSMKVLRKAREKLGPASQVSWADLIAVAGSESVRLCGGPFIPVRLGRLDSRNPDPEGELPSENSDAASLKQSFRRKGFSTQEMVALSGAHTLGSKGFGDPTVFDNSYYSVLLNKPWNNPENNMAAMTGLPSDKILVDDEECVRWLLVYRDDESRLFTDFSAAYTKLIDSGARWKA